MDRALARGEIISELQHLPYHSRRAYALRIALTLLEELDDGNDQRPNHGDDDR
jgi:hypothetical protein